MDAKIELLQEYRPAHNNTAPLVAGFPMVCFLSQIQNSAGINFERRDEVLYWNERAYRCSSQESFVRRLVCPVRFSPISGTSRPSVVLK